MSPELKHTLEYCAGMLAVIVTIGAAFYIGDIFDALSKRIRGRRGGR
jgi:hypothetical protein